jgi:hypothetical protein
MRTRSVLAALALAVPLAVPASLQAFAVSTGQLTINGDTALATCPCVSGGDGSAANPFLVASLTVVADSSPGIVIENISRKSFTLLHATVHVTGAGDGIDVINVTTPSSIVHANVDSPPSQGGGMGIHLLNSSNVVINGDSINSLQSWGIKVEGGVNNTVEFMNLNHNGLTNPASKDTSLAMGAGNPFLLGRSGQAPGGLLLINSSGNHVHDDLLNEDAYANLELVNANDNVIGPGLVSRYPDYFGLSLEGSSGNTITDVSLQTADFDGLLVRGGGNNTILASNFSANGPIGNEWKAGVVPYFIAGAYFGWGTHDNVLQGDSSNFGNTGPSLVIDDGGVPTPPPNGQLGPQNNNPFNVLSGPNVGGDPGGVTVAGAETAAVICGNTFKSFYSPGLDPNAACK